MIDDYTGSNHLTVDFIALTPFAVAELEKMNILHKTAMDYLGREERYEEGLRNFSRINSITDLLEGEILDLHKIPTLRPAHYPFYYLKNLFDVLSSTVLLLNTIIEVEKPDTIVYCTRWLQQKKSGISAFTDDDSIFAEVLAIMGKRPDTRVISLNRINREGNGISTATQTQSTTERMFQWIRDNEYRESVSFAYNIGLVRKNFGTLSALKTIVYYLVPGQNYPVLIYEYGYDWEDMFHQIVQRALRPVIRLTDHSVDLLVEKQLKETRKIPGEDNEIFIENVLMQDERFRTHAVIGHLDLSPLLFPKIAAIISLSVKNSIRAYKAFEYLHAIRPIKAVLLSVHTHSKSFAVVQAAHDNFATVISWQHGGAGYTYQPLMPYVELYNSDYHFVYGDGVKESYRNTIARSGFNRPVPEIISIGSSSFDRMKTEAIDGKPGGKKVKSVLYITSNYYRNAYYISQPTYPIEYDIHLWFVQKAVLDLARINPDCLFTLKLHPTHRDCQPLKDYAERYKITNVRFVVGEKSLVELARSSDIVLFDLVSTGILQAMTTNKPIFVYGGAFKVDEDALRRLTRRAYYSESIDAFTSMVNRCITGTEFPKTPSESIVDPTDQEFLNAYGTLSSDGKSAERALKMLARILKIH